MGSSIADIITTKDLSVEDTSKLKTGDTKRRYDMPKECVDRLIKQGKSAKEAHKLCYPKDKPKKSKQTHRDERHYKAIHGRGMREA